MGTAGLQERKRRGKVVGSKSRAPDMAPVEPKTANTDDPRGRFGRFLRAWLARHDDKKGDTLAKALGMNSRSIRLWMQGETGPSFADLNRVAEALGYADWSLLAAAVERFCEKHPE